MDRCFVVVVIVGIAAQIISQIWDWWVSERVHRWVNVKQRTSRSIIGSHTNHVLEIFRFLLKGKRSIIMYQEQKYFTCKLYTSNRQKENVWYKNPVTYIGGDLISVLIRDRV